jgi:hypothetical protein
MANVRFVDQLKVGAYSSTGGSSGITISNNVDNFVLTATGNNEIINGEAQLQFNGINLAVGGAAGTSRFEIRDTTSSDLLLIKNANTDQGIKVNSAGVLQLIEYASRPTAVAGGIIYNSDSFWIGVSS